MAGAYPKEKDETIYYVRLHGYVFAVKKLDANGKPIQRTNAATGMPIYTAEGDPEYIEKTYEFTGWKTRFTQDGYVSIYKVTKDTDPRIKETLEKLAADRGSEVMSEAAFIKTVNPELYEQMQEESRIEELVASKDQENARLASEVAELKARLSGKK